MKLKIYKWINNTDILSRSMAENEYRNYNGLYSDYKNEPITGIGESVRYEGVYLLYINGIYIKESTKPLKEARIEFYKIIKQKVFE